MTPAPQQNPATSISERAGRQGRRAARWGFGAETNPFAGGPGRGAWERGRRLEAEAKNEDKSLPNGSGTRGGRPR